jgi:homoserine dehydrogenase
VDRGIINGIVQFYLVRKCPRGASFESVLKEAQARATLKPTGFDIEGIDARHKLTILSAIALRHLCAI